MARYALIVAVAALFSSSVAYGEGTEKEQPGASSKPARVPGFKLPDPKKEDRFDATYQFIFFAALEGLYRDGVSSEDVKALLATKGEDGGYLNFIYTCPICMPVEAAIETYAARPKTDHYKIPNYQTTERTFGFGLSKDVSESLRSEVSGTRLKAVNELVSKWLSYRMDHSGLSEAEKKSLLGDLKKRRESGMRTLQVFAKDGPGAMKSFASGYADGDECAICNAALQMPLKLKAP